MYIREILFICIYSLARCRLPLQKAVMEFRRLSALFRYFVSHRERGSSLTDCLILRNAEGRKCKLQHGNVCVRLFTIPENAPFLLSLSLSIIVPRSSLRLFETPLKSQMPHSILRPHARCRS